MYTAPGKRGDSRNLGRGEELVLCFWFSRQAFETHGRNRSPRESFSEFQNPNFGSSEARALKVSGHRNDAINNRFGRICNQSEWVFLPQRGWRSPGLRGSRKNFTLLFPCPLLAQVKSQENMTQRKRTGLGNWEQRPESCSPGEWWLGESKS